jgi:hypothetical protein
LFLEIVPSSLSPPPHPSSVILKADKNESADMCYD